MNISLIKKVAKPKAIYFLKRIKYFIKFKITNYKSNYHFNYYLKYFRDKKGIEIGGPSSIFSKELPIYQLIGSLDGCNFSTKTIWEGDIVEGSNYKFFEKKSGYQFICEANNLLEVPDENYDFLIASHTLEHCANTLKTVKEWLRVIKTGGAILLVLPDKKFTFDHRRDLTSFGHLIDDLKGNIEETDLTHLEEILEFHDLGMDPPAGTKEQFGIRSRNNFKNRCLHHHVFDFELLEMIFKYFNIKIKFKYFVVPFHQVIIGEKQ